MTNGHLIDHDGAQAIDSTEYLQHAGIYYLCSVPETMHILNCKTAAREDIYLVYLSLYQDLEGIIIL